ncbi:MAG: GSCFA domain-containing protein [Muribaculaceae bacterium]|nr:GSCFA domain-containing protein [Muribaculaceae bacterium]
MQLITQVNIDKPSWQLSHSTPVVTIGSCFAVEIGRRMLDRLYDIDINPAGTLFNPASVAATLDRILDGRLYGSDELVEDHAHIRHLMSHHSEFSSADPAEVLDRANSRLLRAAGMLRDDNAVLMVTLGSARAFRYIATGEIVGNCHKLPASEFELTDLTLEDITTDWHRLITRLARENPSLRIILTVSPVRHKAYGLVADRLSKSTLIMACHRIMAMHPDRVAYFPAYEIFTDELRDYRFYAADMVHPSEVGADYVYERFAETYLADRQDLDRRCLALTRRLRHRTINSRDMEFEAATSRLAEELASLSPRIATAIQRLKEEKQ